MNKLLFTIAMAGIMLSANAQTLIKGNFKKGDTMTYVTTQENVIGGQGQSLTTKINSEIQYTILDANDKSASVECLIKVFDFSNEGMDQASEAMDEVSQLTAKLKDFPIIVELDENGAPKGIANRDKVEEKVNTIINEFVDNILKMAPQMSEMMSKETLVQQMKSKLSEEEILNSVTDGVFDLYGKTISNGYEDEKEENGIRLKQTYTIANIFGTQNVTVKGVSNMNKDDVKSMFFKQIEQAGLPEDQVSMIKQNYGQLEAAGMAKLEVNSNETYQMDKDSWLKGLKSTSDVNLFGQNIKETKSINRK